MEGSMVLRVIYHVWTGIQPRDAAALAGTCSRAVPTTDPEIPGARSGVGFAIEVVRAADIVEPVRPEIPVDSSDADVQAAVIAVTSCRSTASAAVPVVAHSTATTMADWPSSTGIPGTPDA